MAAPDSDPPPGRDPAARRTFTFSGDSRPLRLDDSLVRLRYETYWADRTRLDQLPPGETLVRDLVPGEFDEDQVTGEATQVEVWRPGRSRGSGSVRHRRPVGAAWTQSDAEDSANAFHRAGPPGAATGID